MNFFQSQDQARRSTNVLVFYYFLAVLAIIGSVYLAFVGIFLYTRNSSTEPINLELLWRPEVFAAVTGITILIVTVGTVYKILQLRQGGEGIATMLGGSPILPNTTDPYERRLLNVVEEMAIAAGTPVPAVFLLNNEEAINAFAAGYSPSAAVIGVSRGCLKLLSRDELQGVIGHEFSHILNGDMRLNIRLIGVLNGILVLTMIGYYILRGASGSSSSSSSNSKNSGGGIALFGFALLAIGGIGMFFAKLIKSAVSRQREFLADASSVQFTRNPGGISGALKKIAGYDASSIIHNSHAEEASHMFFSSGLDGLLANLFATHPSLKERIRAVDPNWSGEIPEVTMERPAPLENEAAVAGFSANAQPRSATTYQATPAQVAAAVGTPTAAHLSHATGLINAIPAAIQQQAHETFGAQAIIYALLLNRDVENRSKQLAYLAKNAEPLVFSETKKISSDIDTLGDEHRLPLATLTIPSLKYLSPDQFSRFKQNATFLVGVDDEVTLFEYALTRIVFYSVELSLLKKRPPAIRYQNLKQLGKHADNILAALAVAGGDERTNGGSLTAVDEGLSHAMCASPSAKQELIQACVACVTKDHTVTIAEAELLRAICAVLDCPLPPFLQ